MQVHRVLCLFTKKNVAPMGDEEGQISPDANNSLTYLSNGFVLLPGKVIETTGLLGEHLAGNWSDRQRFMRSVWQMSNQSENCGSPAKESQES